MSLRPMLSPVIRLPKARLCFVDGGSLACFITFSTTDYNII